MKYPMVLRIRKSNDCIEDNCYFWNDKKFSWMVWKMICDLCSTQFKDIFDSILRIDYAETGRGKLHEYHLCLKCRQNILNLLNSNSKKNKNIKLEVDTID